MEKTVLVTGANGMLATNIIEKLALAGYKVIGTVRKGRSYRGEGRENVTVVEADFKDETAMKPLVSECDVVFHVAAMTSQSETDYEKFRKVNVESTRMLLDLSVASGVGTFVYVSTANTIGYGAAEGAEMKYPFSKSLYALSKKEAETVALSYQDKLRVVVVNPTFMIGKYGIEQDFLDGAQVKDCFLSVRRKECAGCGGSCQGDDSGHGEGRIRKPVPDHRDELSLS